jgi:hypothetical protein
MWNTRSAIGADSAFTLAHTFFRGFGVSTTPAMITDDCAFATVAIGRMIDISNAIEVSMSDRVDSSFTFSISKCGLQVF